MSALTWTFARLARLSARDVYDLLALRSLVFVVEQNCVFLDADGVDFDAWHLLGRGEDGALLAYLRIVDPDIKYPEASIGRVITAPSVRGQGLGMRVVQEGIARSRAVFPDHAIRINAQARLERFYTALGFVDLRRPNLEDGIPHLEMMLPQMAAPTQQQGDTP